MTCIHARELFSARVDDDLDSSERAALDAHLASCADCRQELERLEETVSLLRRVESPRAPAGFVDRVIAAADPVPWHRRLREWLRPAWPLIRPVAALVVVAGLAVYVWERTPELRRAAPPEVAVIAPEPATGRAAPSARSSRLLSHDDKRGGEVLGPEATGSRLPESTSAPAIGGGSSVVRDPAVAQSPAAPRDPAVARDERILDTKSAPDREETSGQRTAPQSTAGEPAAAADRNSSVIRPVPAPPPAPAQPSQPSRSATRAPAGESGPAPGRSAPAPSSGSLEGRVAPPDARTADGIGAQPPNVVAEIRQKRLAAPPAGAPAPPRAAAITGLLVARNRAVAESEVAALLARVGARQLARRDETGAVILDLEVPQSAYDAFIRGLARIGSWQPDAEPGELPARVPVTLRIVD